MSNPVLERKTAARKLPGGNRRQRGYHMYRYSAAFCGL